VRERDSRPKDLEEVKTYFSEIGRQNEAEKFFDYFSSNGWKVGGRSPMKDWKAAARNWCRRSGDMNKKDKFEGLSRAQKSTLSKLENFNERRNPNKVNHASICGISGS
jgi:hypothetical protein